MRISIIGFGIFRFGHIMRYTSVILAVSCYQAQNRQVNRFIADNRGTCKRETNATLMAGIIF